jgi:hypothetical protein
MNIRCARVSSIFLVVCAVTLASSLLRADVTGSITGVVHDRANAVVAGAKVTITNSQTNLSQSANSAADGSYHFLALAAGNYKITVTAVGFRPYATSDITVQVNDELRLDIPLDVGTVVEVVDVTAHPVRVETESTQLGDVIDSQKMLNLPLNGRSYLDLLGLQAGVAPDGSVTIGGNSGTGERAVSGYITNAGNVSVNGLMDPSLDFLR